MNPTPESEAPFTLPSFVLGAWKLVPGFAHLSECQLGRVLAHIFGGGVHEARACRAQELHYDTSSLLLHSIIGIISIISNQNMILRL